jgi:3-oxoisoapionate decarboxylase
MTRREFIKTTATAVALAANGALFADIMPERCSMGLVEFAITIHRNAWRQQKKVDLGDPLEFLREARRLRAGGIQATIAPREPAHLAAVKRFAEENEMFVEANISPPRDADDVPRFERQVQAALAAGARLARTVIIPGRRYEQFKTLDAYKEACARGERSLRLAEPILARHKFGLAVENHKDQRVDERIDLFKRISSEYVGACVDLGNSFALMEDPLEVVRAFAPWAMTVHIKDQAVRETPDGFEYADVALGKGFLDLLDMVDILRQVKPGIRFSLETITRDPLKIPVLAKDYWATFAAVPATDLARTLRTVRANAQEEPFPLVSRMSVEEQLAAERAAIGYSVLFGHHCLGF